MINKNIDKNTPSSSVSLYTFYMFTEDNRKGYKEEIKLVQKGVLCPGDWRHARLWGKSSYLSFYLLLLLKALYVDCATGSFVFSYPLNIFAPIFKP